MPDRPSSKPRAARTSRRLQELAGSGGREYALFDEAPVAMHEIDRDGIIRRVNRAECSLLGFKPGDLIGRHVAEFVAPADREASRDAVRRKVSGALDLAPFCREFVTRAGARLTLEIHETVIRDGDGAVTGIRSALLDISERQRAEEELRRAQEELEAGVRARTAELAAANKSLEAEIAERRRAEQRLAIQYGVARVLAESATLDAAVGGVLESIGAGLAYQFGIYWSVAPEHKELRCRGLWARPEDEAAAALLHERTFTRGEGLPGQVWESGRTAWIDVGLNDALGVRGAGTAYCCGLAFAIVGGAGTLGVAAFFARDRHVPDDELLRTAALLGSQIGQFIERKGAETDRDRMEARFTAFMENLPGVAFMKDAAGRYVYCNPGMRALTGRDPRAVLHHCDTDIWPADLAFAVAEQDRRVLSSGRPIEALHQIPGPAGAARSWLIYKFPVPDGQGRTSYIGGVAVDVTERQILEDQLRQSQKMDAVGRLAGGVAHDFNNLLTIIGGYGRMVLDQLSTGDRSRGSMEQVLKAADRAAVLTSQLLAFSRRQPAQPKILELNHVVSNVEKMLRRVIGEHIQLRTALDPALGRVKADAGQVEQVLMNLAINARDAMPDGGTLTIETRSVLRRGSSQVKLSVSDTGVGMDAKTRSHVFEPFFTTKGRGKGTGLGLSTVYGIVKQHGGEIVVESSPGAGTRFHIYFPAVDAEAEAPVREAVPQAAGGSETVLLVEDEAGVRRVARDTLRARGYQVLEAADGQEALRIAETAPGRIHVLVTDMIMPLMSGRELARRLLGRDNTIKVVFMSGYTDDVIAYHGEPGSDTEFLQKPFAPEVLARKVREVLDAGKPAAQAQTDG